jgi:RNA polymerase sigma-70 factor (ECF subfamily)
VTVAPAQETVDNGQAFAAVFEADFAYVCTSLHRLGARGQDIEDVAHDVFVVLVEKLATLDRSRSLRPWLFGVAMRLLQTHRRKLRGTTEVPTSSPDALDSSPSPSDEVLAAEQRRLVDDALGELPPEQRAVLVLHAIDDIAMPRVAEALEIPLNTAYSRYRLAKENFSRSLRRAKLGGIP